jgi:hypothetical protein
MSQHSGRSPERSANIFINYRREDSAGHAGRLFDRLSQHFPGRVFMDIDTIEPGVDFAEVIEQAVGACEVLIVVIGREWLRLEDAAGRRRLENPQDFVRMEVAAALERNIRVIPVLVEGASMPRQEELPSELARLARRNAIELSDARWAFDVDRLIQTIEGVLREKRPSAILPETPAPSLPSPTGETTRPRAWMVAAALVALVLAGWIAWSSMKPQAPEESLKISSEDALIDPAPVESPASPAAPEEPLKPAAEPKELPIQDETDAPEEVSAADSEPPLAYGPDTCKQGFVWREAGPNDRVCVTPEIRDQAAEDNRQAEARRDPAGPYGPNTCLQGYVWREAFEGDFVCVTPEIRDQALSDNSQADERRMKSAVRWTRKTLAQRRNRGR